MLRVSIHAGLLPDRNQFNVLGLLDVAYQSKQPLADYLVGMTLQREGELPPALLTQYSRWSASLWDLVARALTAILYRADQAPPSAKPDKRCAYATKLCAVIEKATAIDRGVILGTLEVCQRGSQRGLYTVDLQADLAGSTSAQFEYGCKALNPADLVLRSICWALYGSDQLGPSPALILPPAMRIDGEDRFHVAALTEPALTGFKRYMATKNAAAVPQLAAATDYIAFLRDA